MTYFTFGKLTITHTKHHILPINQRILTLSLETHSPVELALMLIKHTCQLIKLLKITVVNKLCKTVGSFEDPCDKLFSNYSQQWNQQWVIKTLYLIITTLNIWCIKIKAKRLVKAVTVLFTKWFEEDFSPVYKEEVFKIQYLQ